jgi:Domain of unknown function (DUF4124)
MTPMTSTLPLAALLALAPLVADAQTTFRCTGKDGKKYYSATLPPQCEGQPIEQLSPQGVVIRRIDPEGEEKARLAKEAELAKKREEDAIAKEASRRNRALLATYTSEKDIEEARGRALAENQQAIKEIEARINEIKKRYAGYTKEMEFFQEGVAKPSDKKGKPALAAKAPKPPPKLVDDMRTAEVDLDAQQNLLAAKKKEVETINAKYDEDKKRYLDLTKPAPRKSGAQ